MCLSTSEEGVTFQSHRKKYLISSKGGVGFLSLLLKEAKWVWPYFSLELGSGLCASVPIK